MTRPPGYVLELHADELDADRYERLCETARSALSVGNAGGALALLSEAEELWRGQPLAEFAYEPFAQAAIASLGERRVNAREELIEAQLALGRSSEVVSELEAFVREHPFRERARAQLMLALYRCGRQAQALEAFQQARRTLVEELAVEPAMRSATWNRRSSVRTPRYCWLRRERSRHRHPPTPPRHRRRLEVRADVHPRPTRRFAGPPRCWWPNCRSRGSQIPRRRGGPLAGRESARDEIVLQHGGTFVAGLGGELTWVFGIPLVREDDALRALRAADELRTVLSGGPSSAVSPLTVRLGVASGEVIAESPGDLFGDPVAEASTLAHAASPEDILIGGETRHLVLSAIRDEPAVEGTAWRVLELDRQPIRPATASPMVGREEELELALSAFAAVREQGDAKLLTIVGEAGIGKSRLVRELRRRLAGQANVIGGRCLSYGQGITFWPLREALIEAAGEESRAGVRRLLEGADDADVVTDIIAAALDLGPAQSVGEQLPWAVRRLLEVLSASAAAAAGHRRCPLGGCPAAGSH